MINSASLTPDLIKIFIDNSWIDAREYQKQAFRAFQANNILRTMTIPYHYNNQGIKFTISRVDNQSHGGIILTRDNGTTSPIADWLDVKVFLVNIQPIGWHDAYKYQIWCYFDYIYFRQESKGYKTRRTIGYPEYTEIPIDGLDANIVFTINRESNGTIYYQRNDTSRTRSRISDNPQARSYYMGYYRRMTDIDSFIPIIHQPQPINSITLVLPNNITIKETDNEELMCITCNNIQQNIRFLPCKHTIICSKCYPQLTNPRECPICRSIITSIVKI